MNLPNCVKDDERVLCMGFAYSYVNRFVTLAARSKSFLSVSPKTTMIKPDQSHLAFVGGAIVKGKQRFFFFFYLFNKIKAEVEKPDMPRGLSCLASPEGADTRYETPPASELQRLMWTKKGTSNHMDEVQPRIYIGDM